MTRTASIRRRVLGFTLIEFATVMIISGLLTAAGVQLYSIHVIDARQKAARESLDRISSALSVYYSSRGRYPCPANPMLPLDDPDAGVEDCTMADAAQLLGTCSKPGNRGVCKVPGRNTPLSPPTVKDPILVGAVPYRSLKEGMERAVCYSKIDGLPVSCTDPNAFNPTDASMQSVSLIDALDPWGYKMTYVVTASQTDQKKFDAQYGAIAVKTESGVSLTDPPGSAHVVVISHGENHMGAYAADGTIRYPCVAGTQDTKNCEFSLAPNLVAAGSFIDGLRAMKKGDPAYFDDYVMKIVYQVSQLWKFTGPTDEYIRNVNPGNVGIGTSAPKNKLEVVGSARALAVRADQGLCDPLGGNCWLTEKVGGATGMQCPPPDGINMFIMTGIRNAAPLCRSVPLPAGLAGATCPAPLWLVGFEGDGDPICAALP